MVQKYLISAMSVQKNTQPVVHPLKPKESTEKLVEIPIFTLKIKTPTKIIKSNSY